MRIVLITPGGQRPSAGNNVTASRWARVLRSLGHRVRIAHDYAGGAADAMVAVHAWRSAASIRRFKEAHPGRPLVLLLSGTDIYHSLREDPETTLRSMELADALVAINDLAWRVVPAALRRKLRVIYQSAQRRAGARAKSGRTVDLCVVGHLREVKDPLRAAQAARRLPAESRIRVVHVGHAHTQAWADQARAEMARNARYVWRDDVPRSSVRTLLARSRAMVISSINEGGANVVSEAAVLGVPVLASRMDGNVGLLGRDYPGYFPVGDTAALARLMRRVETDATFVKKLRAAVLRRAALFTPSRERAAWKRLLSELRTAPAPYPGGKTRRAGDRARASRAPAPPSR